jgi:hypothetical protein
VLPLGLKVRSHLGSRASRHEKSQRGPEAFVRRADRSAQRQIRRRQSSGGLISEWTTAPAREQLAFYEDGSQRSNRRVPADLLGGLEKDEPARGFIIGQDREIAEKSSCRRQEEVAIRGRASPTARAQPARRAVARWHTPIQLSPSPSYPDYDVLSVYTRPHDPVDGVFSASSPF